MKWPVIALVVTGIAAAFCAALLVASLDIGGRDAKAANDKQSREVKVFVAKRNLPALTVVSADDMEEKTVLSDQVAAGAITGPAKILGESVTTSLVAGETLTSRHFAREGPGKEIASRLPAGMRAMSVSLTHYESLEGLLYPGSVVDVVATFDLKSSGQDSRAVSTTLLQNVSVLAIEEEIVRPEEAETATGEVKEAKEKVKPSTSSSRSNSHKVTIMVNSQQAEALQLAIEYGTITLAMRNPNDQAEVVIDPKVLSEGKLVKLAEFLQANVSASPSEGSTEVVRGKAPVVEVEPTKEPVGPTTEPVVVVVQPLPQPSQADQVTEWEVSVIRGVIVETQKFPAPVR